jgi:hypothetical protein
VPVRELRRRRAGRVGLREQSQNRVGTRKVRAQANSRESRHTDIVEDGNEILADSAVDVRVLEAVVLRSSTVGIVENYVLYDLYGPRAQGTLDSLRLMRREYLGIVLLERRPQLMKRHFGELVGLRIARMREEKGTIRPLQSYARAPD